MEKEKRVHKNNYDNTDDDDNDSNSNSNILFRKFHTYLSKDRKKVLLRKHNNPRDCDLFKKYSEYKIIVAVYICI